MEGCVGVYAWYRLVPFNSFSLMPCPEIDGIKVFSYTDKGRDFLRSITKLEDTKNINDSKSQVSNML